MPKKLTQEKKEQNWLLGNTAAYSSILMECARHLGTDDPLVEAAVLISERRDAIAALRRLCEQCGLPNEWPDDLYLMDIIEKHIKPYWPEEEEDV